MGSQTVLREFLSQTHCWQSLCQVSPICWGVNKYTHVTAATDMLWVIIKYIMFSILPVEVCHQVHCNLQWLKNSLPEYAFTKTKNFILQTTTDAFLQAETQTSEVELNKIIPAGQKHPSTSCWQDLSSDVHWLSNLSLYLNMKTADN